MRLQKASEKDRFLGILAQAKYEMMDGVHIPGIERRRFSEEEYEYIHGICKYIERMVELYDKKGLLVKQEYAAADVAEVRHGRWMEEIGMLMCSECGDAWALEQEEVKSFHYCPNCGSRMDLDGDTE